jgi:hypothetical protein
MKPKKTIEQKVREEFPEFADECQALDSSQIDARLAQFAKDLEAIGESVEADDGLAAAKEAVSNMAAPYREAKAAIRLKGSYLIRLLKERA